MKFLLILVSIFICLALAQQEESSAEVSTLSPSSELEDQPKKPFGKPFAFLFPQVLPGLNRLYAPYQPDADLEYEKVRNPLEYQFNDRFSVEPFFTFPPNAGGGLNFRYRF